VSSQTEITLQQVRYAALQAEIEQFGVKHPQYTPLYRALDAISQAALAHAKATNVSSDDFKYQLLEPGFEVIQLLRLATEPDNIADKERVNLWQHKADIFGMVVQKKTPAIWRSDVEAATGRYLALPYREQSIDRLFVDVLIAMETCSFCDEMLNETSDTILNMPPRSPLKRKHPFGIYVKGMFWNLMTMAAIDGGMIAMYNYGIIGAGWAAGISLTLSALIILSCVLMTVALPFRWKADSKDRSKVRMLMSEMVHCYNELSSDGPISARRLLERLKEADQKGVAWPAPLYALLDDVMTGTGRL
jgi:hypothetical protein